MSENRKDKRPAALRPDYEKEILEILHSSLTNGEKMDLLSRFHDGDIADTLPLLDDTERSELFESIKSDRLADIFEHLSQEEMADYLKVMTPIKAAHVLNNIETDTTADLLDYLDNEQKSNIIELLSPEIFKKVSIIRSYDENLIGSQMSANFVTIDREATIKQAMNELVRQAPLTDNLSTLYVIDKNNTYYGAIELSDLITAPEEESLEEIIQTSYPFVYATEPIDTVVEEIRDYNEDSLPVLSSSKRLLGVLTSHALLDVVDDELSEDYVKLAAIKEEEDLQEPLFASVKKRLPWLLSLLILGLFVSWIVSFFEGIVAELTIIMTFQSLILGMAGNCGTQSLAVTIRVLSEEDLDGKQVWKLLYKEGKVGFFNGLIMGAATWLFVAFYLTVLKGYPFMESMAIGSCVGLALWIAMTISALTGTCIPLLFQWMHVDPAVASGPLITTLNDLVGIITYYSLAWFFLLH